MQAVTLSSTSHELPNTAGTYSRNRVRMEARLGLCQIDQVLWNAFFFENILDQVPVAAAERESVFQSGTPPSREVIDVPSNLVGHHQRQIRVGDFDLLSGLSL